MNEDHSKSSPRSRLVDDNDDSLLQAQVVIDGGVLRVLVSLVRSTTDHRATSSRIASCWHQLGVLRLTGVVVAITTVVMATVVSICSIRTQLVGGFYVVVDCDPILCRHN